MQTPPAPEASSKPSPELPTTTSHPPMVPLPLTFSPLSLSCCSCLSLRPFSSCFCSSASTSSSSKISGEPGPWAPPSSRRQTPTFALPGSATPLHLSCSTHSQHHPSPSSLMSMFSTRVSSDWGSWEGASLSCSPGTSSSASGTRRRPLPRNLGRERRALSPDNSWPPAPAPSRQRPVTWSQSLPHLSRCQEEADHQLGPQPPSPSFGFSSPCVLSF